MGNLEQPDIDKMKESFLHYLWLYQRFSKSGLKTVEGFPVNILRQGFPNKNAGPDFTNSKAEIGGMEWNGSVEIHLRSSQWKQHNHHRDDAYNNVILHVVWTADGEVYRADGTLIPTLELKGRVLPALLQKYNRLIYAEGESIPCATQFSHVKQIIKYTMLDSLVTERLMAKSAKVNELLTLNADDWEETTYQLLLQTVGLKVNTEAFGTLARSIPFKIIKKQHAAAESPEALLFGMSGFLEHIEDDYQHTLATEYRFLVKKYGLERQLNQSQWKFLRLRPAGFPTLRLAQLAALLADTQSLFASFIRFESAESLKKQLKVMPSPYWQKHYHFGKASKTGNTGFGEPTTDLIMINVVAPLLVAYGRLTDDQTLIDKAIKLLEQLRAENNKITRIYSGLALKPKSALDSQAMIQWYNEYCLKKKCLSCAVGNEIMAGA